MKKGKDVIDVLARTKLFAGVAQEQIGMLVSENIGVLRRYQKGTTLISAGDDPGAVSVVISGTVLVNRLSKDGTETIIHALKERKTIGIEFVQNNGYRSLYNYIAQTEVWIYSIPADFFTERNHFEDTIARQLLINMVGLLSHEALRQSQKMFILSMGSIRRKLMMFLYYEYQKTNSKEFDISFNRETLAAYLCVNRSALSRELGAMEKDGLIRTKGKHFEIFDPLLEIQKMI